MAALRNTWKGKNGPLLIAEVGGNHEGDFDYAKRLVELAINSQVDIVKLQLYTGSNWSLVIGLYVIFIFHL